MKHSHSAEIDQLLKHVEEKFSDLILPEGVVTKLELIGKGICQQIQISSCTGLLFKCYTGAFGIVHKGKLKNPDSTTKTVAIKSIKCKFQ